MKKIIFFVVYILLSVVNGSTQSVEVKFSIIIDTDCAPDDLRAICLFAAIKEIDLLAITTTDGSLAPDDGLVKVNQLIPEINKKDILTASGKELNSAPPAWREYCEKVTWGNDNITKNSVNTNASKLIIEKINKSEEPVIFICLAPLTNLADAFKESPEIKNKIKKIIWYNEYPPAGFHYLRNKQAADYILSTNLSIDIISNLNKEDIHFDNTLLQAIEKISTPYALSIAKSHRSPIVYEKIANKHLQLWDDLIPVYLLYPELFDMKPTKNKPNISINVNFDTKAAKEKIVYILAQNYTIDRNIVFEKFPVDQVQFRSDVKKIMDEIINKYGKEEWRICVLTNEIHGHLGIYSIVGAKMGLKAREIFNVDIDKLKVLSYAGDITPLSCLNDGLQISTGATLGQGKITIATDSACYPKAIFEYENQRIGLSLKDEYRKIIEADINMGIVQYGNLTSGYWKLIRKLGLKYWLEWNRNDIFNKFVKQ